MDSNIKTMYTVMAKTEELSNRMKSTEALAARMWVFNFDSWNSNFAMSLYFDCFSYRRDVRRLVDVLDNVVWSVSRSAVACQKLLSPNSKISVHRSVNSNTKSCSPLLRIWMQTGQWAIDFVAPNINIVSVVIQMAIKNSKTLYYSLHNKSNHSKAFWPVSAVARQKFESTQKS